MSADPKAPYPFPSIDACAYGQDQHGYWQAFELFGVYTRFRWIAPGSFKMGGGGEAHDVTLTWGYWLAETTCTQALWREVTGENPSRFEGEDRPVEQVSWDDINQQFLPRLAESLGDLQPGLPTEAQWEYACRAGTTTKYAFGDELTPDIALYDYGFDDEDRFDRIKRDGRYTTAAVYDFQPNHWGLYQMHGNVWEWCADWQGGYPAGSAVDPTGPDVGRVRVLRGGSWFSPAQLARSAQRNGIRPDYRDVNVGFRPTLVDRVRSTA